MTAHSAELAASDDIGQHQEHGVAAISAADLRRAAWTSSLGSALEYYDFALYSLA